MTDETKPPNWNEIKKIKPNEYITIQRLYSGDYLIFNPRGPKIVGSAASTIIALAQLIFTQEAGELPGEWQALWKEIQK